MASTNYKAFHFKYSNCPDVSDSVSAEHLDSAKILKVLDSINDRYL
ncbi:MAG: hypothetical protein Q7S74_06405 [Nanoarchaeota archaeon]|nr:hypothetical protein [Nanoarchaeota archaeon]